MTDKEDLIKEFGLEIAREKVFKQIADLIEKRNEKDFKIKMVKLIKDRDEIEKGNLKIINKYIGVVDNE